MLVNKYKLRALRLSRHSIGIGIVKEVLFKTLRDIGLSCRMPFGLGPHFPEWQQIP